MKPKDSRQRLFEVMARLDKTFKPKLNEYDNYNYPPGADADPNAPWNQVDDSLDYIEGQYSMQYPKSFNVRAHSADGKGTFDREGFEIIDDMIENGIEKYTPEQQQAVSYFEQYRNGGLTDEIGKSQEFQGMVDLIWDATYGDKTDFEWDYPDMDEGTEQNNMADPTTKKWGDAIIQMLHYNNDEKVNNLFGQFARQLKGKAPEEAARKFKGLTDYIIATVANDSVFSDNTAEHFTNMYLPNHLLGKI